MKYESFIGQILFAMLTCANSRNRYASGGAFPESPRMPASIACPANIFPVALSRQSEAGLKSEPAMRQGCPFANLARNR
jgi:hypothetical protein